LCVAQLIGWFLKCILPKTNMLLLLLIWGMSLIKNFCCLIVER
jgi:hypothetical protein